MIARVLIVEDEPYEGEDAADELREIAPSELNAHGISDFVFAYAKWGAQARDLLNEATRTREPYHVMLLDLNLPENLGDRYVSADVGFNKI